MMTNDQYLKGISTTSSELSFIPGYIFLYILEDMINATETNNMEQKIHIHTNWGKKYAGQIIIISVLEAKGKKQLHQKEDFEKI